MSSRILKKTYSSSFLKRKPLDNILKVKKIFNLKQTLKVKSNTINNSKILPGKNILNNKEINNNINRNSKSLLYENKTKSNISLKKTNNPFIGLNYFPSSSNIMENNKYNGMLINFKSINNNFVDNKNNEKLKYNSYNQDCKISQKLNNFEYTSKINVKEKNKTEDKKNNNCIQTFNKKLTLKHLNILLKQYKYKKKIENEEEKLNDKKCLLKKDFKVNNFILNPEQVIEYLNLNEKNNFFKSLTIRKNINKYSRKYNLSKNKNKICNRNRNRTPMENGVDKIKNIYPTIMNIEGHRNRKMLYKLNDENKKKKKNEKSNCVYYRHHFNLQKKMIKERNKVEQLAKENPSEFAYKSKLLILSMKMYQRAIHQLQKKISFKFNLDLPLYNLFLNLD